MTQFCIILSCITIAWFLVPNCTQNHAITYTNYVGFETLHGHWPGNSDPSQNWISLLMFTKILDAYLFPGKWPTLHSSRLIELAWQIYVHMGNFHPTSLRSHLAQGGISPNLADSFPMWTRKYGFSYKIIKMHESRLAGLKWTGP